VGRTAGKKVPEGVARAVHSNEEPTTGATLVVVARVIWKIANQPLPAGLLQVFDGPWQAGFGLRIWAEDWRLGLSI